MRLLELLLIGDAQNTCSKRDVVGAKTKTKTAYGRHVVGKATYSKVHMGLQPAPKVSCSLQVPCIILLVKMRKSKIECYLKLQNTAALLLIMSR